MFVPSRAQICAGPIVGGNFDGRNQGPVRQVFGRDIDPVRSPVSGEVDETIVTPGPQDTGFVARLREREDSPVDLGTRVVLGDGPAGSSKCGRFMSGQIRTDLV